MPSVIICTYGGPGMIEKFRGFINSKSTPFILIWISIIINSLPIWLRPTWLSICLIIIAGLLALCIAAKQPLPLWSEEEIKRWEVTRAGGERRFIIGPPIVIPAFLILYLFLLINVTAVWSHSFSRDILEFDAWYSAIATVLLSLIYFTRKRLWSLREKTYKASVGVTPSNNLMQASPRPDVE